MEHKLSKRFWLVLIIFSLVGQIAWVIENMYFNVFIYKMFNASANDISIMVLASAIAATLTTIFIGALSDKLGKRKVFMSLGYILWGLSILSFAFIRVDVINKLFPNVLSASSMGISLVIVMDCVMTFFGSSANDACFNAWLTDSTDETNRGKAEGINAIMPLVSILVVFGGFMSFNLDLQSSWITIFIIIGLVVTLIGILGLFIIKEPGVKLEENANYIQNIIYGFKPSIIKENKKLYIDLICFMVFGIAIQIFMPYLILYYSETLKLSNYVIIMAPAIIMASIFTLVFSRMYDSKGYVFTIKIPVVLLIVGFIILSLSQNIILVFIGSLLMMCGYIGGTAIFGAVIKDGIPKHKAGMFQGLRIVAQVLIPGIIGPLIGAQVLQNAEQVINSDGTTSFLPNQNIFVAALVVTMLLAVMLTIYFNSKKNRESHM